MATTQELYDAASAAYLKALKSKSYGDGVVSKVNHDVDKLRSEMEYWAQKLADESGSSVRSLLVTFPQG